jgi:hypothetical protein
MGDSKEFPGLGFDPAPGIVSSVDQLAESIREATNKVAATEGDLDRALGDAQAWQGRAGAGCRNAVQAMSPHVAILKEGLLSVLMSVGTWSSQLGEYQRTRGSLEGEAVEAQARIDRAKNNPDLKKKPVPGVPLTEDRVGDAWLYSVAQGEVDAAKQALEDVRKRAHGLQNQHDESAKNIAKQIRDAADRLEDLRKHPGKGLIVPSSFQKPAPVADDLPENRPFNVRPPTDQDQEVLNQVNLMVGGQVALGNPQAAELLDHWLGKTGEDFEFDTGPMLEDVPLLQQQVKDLMTQNAGKGFFDTGWQNGKGVSIAADIENLEDNGQPVSKDLQGWYYAFNGYEYRISGSSEIVNGVPVGQITLDVYKRYNWGNALPGENRGDIDMKFATVPQNDIAGLHASGLAQDFDVVGSSTMWVENPQ